MNIFKQLPAFLNVIATGIAVCDLMPEVGGQVLEAIKLRLGGTTFTRANIVGWRLKANGKVIRASTGADTHTINTYYGGTFASNEMFIDFMFNQGRTPNAFAAGALDIGANSGIRQLTLEVDISGATAPTLTGFAAVSPSLDIPHERRLRWLMLQEHRAQISINAAGEFNLAAQLPHFSPAGPGSVYRSIHFFSANLTDIRVRRQGVEEWTKTSVSVLQAMQKRAGRVPQTNHVVFDPCLDNMIEGRLFDTTSAPPSLDPAIPGGAGIRSADFYATFSGAETFWVQTQELIALNAF